jgi:hypothetical protein
MQAAHAQVNVKLVCQEHRAPQDQARFPEIAGNGPLIEHDIGFDAARDLVGTFAADVGIDEIEVVFRQHPLGASEIIGRGRHRVVIEEPNPVALGLAGTQIARQRQRTHLAQEDANLGMNELRPRLFERLPHHDHFIEQLELADRLDDFQQARAPPRLALVGMTAEKDIGPVPDYAQITQGGMRVAMPHARCVRKSASKSENAKQLIISHLQQWVQQRCTHSIEIDHAKALDHALDLHVIARLRHIGGHQRFFLRPAPIGRHELAPTLRYRVPARRAIQ